MKVLGLIISALSALSAIALTILIGLLCIKLGWSLFIIPVFHLPEITWAQALGFSFLASAFRSSRKS